MRQAVTAFLRSAHGWTKVPFRGNGDAPPFPEGPHHFLHHNVKVANGKAYMPTRTFCKEDKLSFPQLIRLVLRSILQELHSSIFFISSILSIESHLKDKTQTSNPLQQKCRQQKANQ